MADAVNSEVSIINQAINKWHQVLRGEIDFDEVLHEDCVFWSPVLFHPQEGRELTKMYLSAAALVFPGDDGVGNVDIASGDRESISFKYTKRVLSGNHAVLEFETSIDGIHVNGVDIISCDDDGLIVEFKVMIRPRQGLEKVREQMLGMIEARDSVGVDDAAIALLGVDDDTIAWLKQEMDDPDH